MKTQFLILCLIVFPFLISAQQQWVDFTRATPQPPIIQLVSSDSTEVEFDVEVCGMYEIDTTVSGTAFQRIIIPGGGLTTVSGEPEIPYIRQLIAIPECDSVTLSVTVTDTSVLQDYYVYPAPDFEEVTGQDSIVYIQEVFDFDTTAYNTNQYYPQVNAEIKSTGYFRAQKYAEVFIYPIQFNPVTEEILVDEEYEITLAFENPSTSINANVGVFNNIATNTMLNYTSTGVSAIVNDNATEDGTVQWVTLTGVSQASNVVGDYLIICSDSLWDSTNPDSEILRIATHRATYNGFDVAILNVENILDLGFQYENLDYINEQKMRSCINLIYEGENAQNTQDGKLGYLLLIGDVDAGNTGMPTSKDTYLEIPSDFYFSCITKENGIYDTIGDLFVGRFCVDNNSSTGSTELKNIVDKTLLFENEYGFYNWRNHIGFINDTIINDTLHEEYFEHFYDTLIYIIEDEDVSIVNSFELNNAIHDSTMNIFNQGSFYIQYDGHGQIHTWNDWLNIDHFEDELENTVIFPFVFSHACQTGHLDYTLDCLGEMLTTYSDDMGCVGFLGASRTFWGSHLYPIQFIAIQECILLSIWDHSSFITGEFILEAKINSCSYQENLAFNLFGDPALNLMAQGDEITVDRITPDDASITKEVFVRENVTFTIPEGTTFGFESGGKLIIEEDATLEIEDNVTLSAISGVDSLIVYGDLIVGDSVTFESGTKAEFVIDIRNPDLIESISYATFDDVTLIAYAKALAFLSGTFEDCSIEFRKAANNQYFLNSCYFVNSPLTAKRYGPVINRYLGNIEINECTFDNDNGSSAIYIDGFPNFQIADNELSYSTGDGISLYYAGSATGTSQEISNNLVEFTGNTATVDAHGIKAYYSHADIKNNHVYDNKTGLACLQRSSLSLKGNSLSSTEDETQRIQNNTDYQVYSDGSSFPYDFEYNSIYDDQASTYYVYMDTCLFTPYDIENNYWGSDFDESDNLEPWNAYDYTPEWQPTWGSLKSGDPAQDLFYSAQQNVSDSLYAEARIDFREVIEEWPESKYVKASVKELLGLAYIHGQDYTGLQEYLESIETLWEDEEIIQVTEYIINWCDVCLGNYPDAINWFENRILNPLSYEDSICSIIDLGYIYVLMEEGGSRSIQYTGDLVQYKPDSREAYEKNREALIDLIPRCEEQTTGVEEDNLNNIRSIFRIYPNPVTNVTTVEYSLKDDAAVVIKLYNSKGEFIQFLFASHTENGSHSFTWNTNELANGIYFISFEIDRMLVETKRVVLLK